MRINADGTMRKVELYGPPDFETGSLFYHVLVTAVVMLNAESLCPLDAQCKTVEKYVRRYGQGVWSLIHQADTRVRVGAHGEIPSQSGRGTRARRAEGLDFEVCIQHDLAKEVWLEALRGLELPRRPRQDQPAERCLER